MPHPEESVRILILGKGEIARQLCALAVTAGYRVQVVEPGATAMTWPRGVTVQEQVYAESPFTLPPHTHAIVARGHEGDAESVAALLNHAAEQVYLIASARRAQSVIMAATPLIENSSRLTNLSAPAGLDLGGKSSSEIALSLLAEIQMRHHSGSGRALTDMREQRAARASSSHTAQHCPGKRP
jgi:xanthine dehydrogenase accessory factor